MKSNMRLLVSALALALAGCGGGGGGGGDDEEVVPALVLGELQGFWNGPVTGADFGGASIARAVVLDDGRAWVFLHGAGAGEPLVGLAAGRLGVTGRTFSGAGTRYGATGAAAGPLEWSATRSASALAFSARSGGNVSSNMALAYDNRFEADAVAADVQGSWVFTQAGGSIAGTWNIAANGALSGTRTPGCTYTGQVLPHAGVAVYDVSITEACTGSAAKALTGIAKLNSAKTFLTFGLTTQGGSEGMAFVVGRPAS